MSQPLDKPQRAHFNVERQLGGVMKRWRTESDHACDPGQCPICRYSGVSRKFDGAAPQSDDSCERCGARWQTEWRASGYVGLEIPAFENPDLRVVSGVWQEALRKVFPMQHCSARLLGLLRTMALAASWLAPNDKSDARVLKEVGGYDVALEYGHCTPGELYGLVSKLIVDRLVTDARDRAISTPGTHELAAYLEERRYRVGQKEGRWAFDDEDGIAIPMAFSSENEAILAAWLYASAILPARPTREDQTRAELAQSRLDPDQPTRRWIDSCGDHAVALKCGQWIASSYKVQVLVVDRDVFLLLPTNIEEWKGFRGAYEELHCVRVDSIEDEIRREDEQIRREIVLQKYGPGTDWLVKGDESQRNEWVRNYPHFKRSE